MKTQHDTDDLEAFFNEIIDLVLDHDIIDDTACVTADKLGKALCKVDPTWFDRYVG